MTVNSVEAFGLSLCNVDIFYCVSSTYARYSMTRFAFGSSSHLPAHAHEEQTDPIMLLRVATLAAIGVASVNAAVIIETYPLTADCDVRSPFEPLVGFPRDK
jgi:hypothetical protein